MDNSYMNKKIIITGGNSRFGQELKKSFSGKSIIYTTRKDLNILNIKSIANCLKKHKPEYLIHLASLSRPMIIHEKDIGSSIDVNIIGTANIVKKCFENNIKLIYEDRLKKTIEDIWLDECKEFKRFYNKDNP